MEVLSINQNPIVNVKLSSLFNMQVASFIVNMLEDIVDVVMHYSHSVDPFFCGRGGEFVIVIEVYCVWIKAIKTSVGGEFVGGRRWKGTS